MMPIKGQIIIVLFVLAMLVFVLELLRRRKISAAITLWWVFIVLSIIFLVLNQSLLNYITYLMGAAYPFSALILLSLFFILLMLVYFSMKVSVLSDQMKEIVQFLSLFKHEFDKSNRRKE